MKKFSFSLQFLLDKKEKEEDLLKRKIAELIKREEKEKRELEEMEQKMAFCQKKLQEKMCQRVKIPLVILYYSYFEKLKDQIERKREAIQGILRERKEIDKALMQVSREKKLLEKMKDKKWKEFVKLRNKLEQKLIDESAVARFYQKIKNGLFQAI